MNEVDVHMQTLGLVFLSLIGCHEGLCALYAINKARTSQNHALIDHLFERLIEANVPTVK